MEYIKIALVYNRPKKTLDKSLLALRSKRLNIAVGDMPKKETSTSSSLFCKSIFIKSLVFELMLNVFSKDE
jgi:hypothetical protein